MNIISLRRSIGIIITLLAFVVMPFTISTVAHADTASAGYHCGSTCNGHSPSWVNPANGIQCSNSASVVAQGSPTAYYTDVEHGLAEDVTETDTYMILKVMYSSVCQTIWMTATNTQATGRTSCAATVHRIISPEWLSPAQGCAAAGTTNSTVMADDYNSTGGIAAQATYHETMPRTVCNHAVGPGYPCDNSSVQDVDFMYSKAY